ncbi:hypothetical protein Lfu02_48070 [Longispora fulva]|uniref:Uncharacterized protein n=1 Tax=Longispora fulva TaxID=619741 RepID=A0A8J7GCS6_9ACTN|nr:hypothetical protein [Longispora fulva]MBG6138183.1 hypothetical protein [Longispora fulva]GIG60435.1 hypothetical protein Lfu02_48070 [Longispora fulva]
MKVDWSTAVQQVVIQGRPGDVKSAALGWEEVLKRAGDIKSTLERDVADLAQVWTGPAYESYKTHMMGIAKKIGDAIDKVNSGTGVVPSLQEAATKLAEAQNAMPVPHGMFGELMAARNGKYSLGPKFCEITLSNELLKNPVLKFIGSSQDMLEQALHDIEGPALKTYDKVSGEYEGVRQRMPDAVHVGSDVRRNAGEPELTVGEGVSGVSGGPDLGAGGAYPSKGFAEHQPGAFGSAHTPGDPRDAWNKGWEDAGDFRPPASDSEHPSATGLAGTAGPFGSGGTGFSADPSALGLGGGSGSTGLAPGSVPGGGTLGRPVDLPRTLAAGNSARLAGSTGFGGMGAIGTPAANSAEDKSSYSTWLREDRTIWFGDEEIAPAVLGKVEEPASDWPAGVEMVRFIRPQD